MTMRTSNNLEWLLLSFRSCKSTDAICLAKLITVNQPFLIFERRLKAKDGTIFF